ncbi:MAG: DUF1003 domain-containing protein [Proteobacteria bacterium]|nr:DUF1003 domain-containing protein [Pseudomonadota bacterium]
MDINELIASETLHIQRLDELVRESIAEEKTLSSSLIEAEKEDQPTLSQRIADQVASFGGSWTFILSFSALIAFWIIFNMVWMLNRGFDPYPFILLNLILSCIAAFQAPIIMMSQNRQEDKDRRRSRSDYMINLKAELEVRGLHRKIDLLLAEEMKTLFQVQQTQVELLLKIQERIERLPVGFDQQPH